MFLFLLYIWLFRRHQRSWMKWCVAFRWPQKVTARHVKTLKNCTTESDRERQPHKTWDAPDFSSSRIWPCKNKKLIDFQVFNRTGKTMKKLYKFQMLPRTPAYLYYLDVYISRRRQNSVIYKWIVFLRWFPALEHVRGVIKALQTSIMVTLTEIVGNVNL